MVDSQKPIHLAFLCTANLAVYLVAEATFNRMSKGLFNLFLQQRIQLKAKHVNKSSIKC